MAIKAVVSLSGGMDSATLLAEVLASEREVVAAVGFAYGSKHNLYELDAAEAIAHHYKVKFMEVRARDVFRPMKSNLLRAGEIPEGHYEAESMRQTVVPGRNTIFAGILSGIALSLEADEVFMGIHSGDHFIYPDCRPQWAIAMAGTIQAGTDGKVALAVPFLRMNKASILTRGFDLKVPYELTRTCYKDQEIACGKCGSCQERLAAFADHNVPDPIEYETRELIPKA